jgi:hypothetical protein
MLVCELMDACISVCTVAKPSICRSSRPIPSVEFSPTNSPKDEGEALHPFQPSRASSHRIHECDQTLTGGESCTSSYPQCYGWKCHHRLWL